jgi:hypothetical protein
VKEVDERRKKKERNRAHPVSDNILYCSNKPGTFFVSKFLAEKNGEGKREVGCGTAAAEKRKGFNQRGGEK